MKHFLLLQYCVSVVCIASSTAGSSQRQPEHHRIHRRQGDSNQDDCDMVVHDELCTNGFYQDVVNVYQRCNDAFRSTIFQDYCTPNSMGGYCFFSQYNPLERNVRRVCASSNSTCSQECRDLLISTRSELGCCIQSFRNRSNHIPYAYSLWSSCDVEPVTQECPPSTVTLSPTPVDPTCSNNGAALLQLLYSAVCKRQYRRAVLNRLSLTEGCQNYSSSLTEFSFCSSNRLGTYCRAAYSDNLFTAASESCSNTSTCDPLCIETLNNITNTVGCCFNDSTGNQWDWLSAEFWTMCKS